MAENERENSAANAFKKRMNDVILAGFATSGLALGSELGLFKVMSQFDTWASSQEIADASQCKERYVREWLYQMTSCGIIEMKEESEHFFLPLDHRDALTGTFREGTMVSASRYIMAFGAAFPQLHEAFKKTGPPGIDFPVSRFALNYVEEDRDMEAYVEAMLPQLSDDIRALLESGISCCDAGGGIGSLAITLARRYPNSHFTSLDFSSAALDKGKAEAARLGISNVTFAHQDLGEISDDWINKFDFITMVDVLHDLPQPLSAVKSMYKMLKPGSYLALADVRCDSDPHVTTKNEGCGRPAPMIYSFSLYHCMSSCLSYPGAAGLGPAVGFQTITRLLKEGGFSDVKLSDIYLDNLFICKKPKA